MTKHERVKLLEEAETQIRDAIYKLREALDGTDQEAEANAYIIPHLETWIGEGNPYDKGIPEYINGIYDAE